MSRWAVRIRYWTPMLLVTGGCVALGGPQQQPVAAVPSAVPPERALVQAYCIACHNNKLKTAGLALDAFIGQSVSRHPEVWEKVVRRLRARQMPPAGLPRPEESTYRAVLASLEASLDTAAAATPNPGRTDTFRRLNRTEYRNAIRDLLALDVDVAALLPMDESSHGFDNVTVGDLSPTLLDRYMSAAEKISRLAVGIPSRSPGGDTITLPPDLTQEEHLEGLPLGTRGGAVVPYTFPLDAEYEIQVRLARDRDEHVEGLTAPHQLELLLDRERVQLFLLEPPRSPGDHATADQHLKVRLAVKAGPHELGVAFLKNPSVLVETERQPYQARFNMYRHPRMQPAVYSISILGPYGAKGPGETPSRRRIFTCRPANAGEEEDCARRILTSLARRAFRRPVSGADLERPLQFYREARAKRDFDAGIEMALSALLVSPEFLFRVEREPAGLPPHTAYRISDLELATRLSFFLWSSIPDEELLEAAVQGKLRRPAVLEQQVRRMLKDGRSQALVSNFAEQWLYLRNLASISPDMRLFPDFDDNLRRAFRRETELLFESILREDRNVLDLLRANYTFVNERLAKHYGIPNVYGSRFRRVTFDQDAVRGGLLRQGSILTVTSYATRTSPVIRGKWILDNLLGVPPPPPPGAVPALKENTGTGQSLSVRERLAEHRANPACSGCHQLMDPVGFALENYDAVGRWRTHEDGRPIDAAGGLPDGSRFSGVSGLQQALLRRPEVFVGTLTEKLLTYALGRGVEYYDAPAIRKVVREAREKDFRFSSLVLGIAGSTPFQMRRSQ
jgi:mono/diheme cytochrome c family protein